VPPCETVHDTGADTAPARSGGHFDELKPAPTTNSALDNVDAPAQCHRDRQPVCATTSGVVMDQSDTKVLLLPYYLGSILV
jgi:hypothetical protein